MALTTAMAAALEEQGVRLTPMEAARLLEVKPAVVRRLCQQKRLVAERDRRPNVVYRRDANWRIKPTSLVAYRDAEEQKALSRQAREEARARRRKLHPKRKARKARKADAPTAPVGNELSFDFGESTVPSSGQMALNALRSAVRTLERVIRTIEQVDGHRDTDSGQH